MARGSEVVVLPIETKVHFLQHIGGLYMGRKLRLHGGLLLFGLYGYMGIILFSTIIVLNTEHVLEIN